MGRIVVKDYDPRWATDFLRLRDLLARHVGADALAIEHVGSTSVPGLAAKPIIDLDIIVRDKQGVEKVVADLEKLGYRHEGDLGIKGREAFSRRDSSVPDDYSGQTWPEHHLYVCVAGCASVENHLQVRDYLRAHPDKARQYGELKKRLAVECAGNIDLYVERKTAFILSILAETGFEEKDLEDIKEQNRASS